MLNNLPLFTKINYLYEVKSSAVSQLLLLLPLSSHHSVFSFIWLLFFQHLGDLRLRQLHHVGGECGVLLVL